MQAVQNMAAKITLGKGKYDSMASCLRPVTLAANKVQDRLKIVSLVHKCLHGEALPYLARMMEYTKLTRPGLHSEVDNTRLLVPKTSKNTFAARSFSVLGPTLWNELPRDLRKIVNYAQLQKGT